MDSEFIRQAKTLAEKVFKTRAFEKHVFHNFDHTQDVVNAVGHDWSTLQSERG